MRNEARRRRQTKGSLNPHRSKALTLYCIASTISLSKPLQLTASAIQHVESSCTNTNNLHQDVTPIMPSKTYEQDGEEAREIAKYLPYFPFKGIPRFYDIGGFLAQPEVFQKIVDIFVQRYEEIGIDSVAG